ncbi:cytochrome P450 3A5 [Truncatella angustata]|uniref:Cytochrome P450 3A5 n=1 Tax=Truncatella angustata TaxID=152316 RepID=A0A9P8UTA1_9PEZI|nr:cytochrome P450 3A5 [Truncatella angustata]KAH6658720.1 cytochrome P450 3A5 [Truncatella angustata]
MSESVDETWSWLLKLVLFLAMFVVVVTYRLAIYPRFLSSFRQLPGPKNDTFLLGQLVNQYRASEPTEMYQNWASQWPDAPFIRYKGLLGMEQLLINGVEAHKQVLQTYCYYFKKPGLFARLVEDISGRGLLFAEGHEHKRQRKLIAHAFSASNLRKLFPVFVAKAQDLTICLEEVLRMEGEQNEVEVLSIFSKATMDVIGASTLGVELKNLRSAELEMDFLQCYDRMFNQPSLSALISFVDAHVPIRRWLPLEASRGYLEASKEVKRMLAHCIRVRSQEIETEKGARDKGLMSRDLLTYMIEERVESGLDLSDDDILGHLLNFISAGHETTSGLLTWAAYVLATEPEIQKKIRGETISLRQDHMFLEYASVDSLPYLDNFVRELLRVYSPAVAVYREAIEDVTICGIDIPKGTVLTLSPCATNLSTKIWGENALKFDPDRWETLSGAAASAYGTQTFANGPRICLGKQYSIMEVKVMLIELLSNYRLSRGKTLVELGDRPVPTCSPSVTLRPQGGLKIKLQRLYS